MKPMKWMSSMCIVVTGDMTRLKIMNASQHQFVESTIVSSVDISTS